MAITAGFGKTTTTTKPAAEAILAERDNERKKLRAVSTSPFSEAFNHDIDEWQTLSMTTSHLTRPILSILMREKHSCGMDPNT